MLHIWVTLKNLREEYGYSQEQVAEVLWTNRTTVAFIESWKRAVKANELERFAQIFDKTTDEILKPKKAPSIKVDPESKKMFEKILLYILWKCSWKPNVGKTVLYKLLYFVEFNYFEKNKQALMWIPFVRLPLWPAPYKFDEMTEVLENNQKITKIVTPYHGNYQSRIIPNVLIDDSELSVWVREVIDDVIKKLSNMTATELSDYSHGDIPWQRVRDMEQIPLELALERKYPYSVLEREQAKNEANDMIVSNKSFAFLANEEDLYEHY
jgi:transcriptional regulator with XRE-family HTH domain